MNYICFVLLFVYNNLVFAIVLFSLAEEKKAEGNLHYRNQDYRKALACYSRAIELCPESTAYYGNRAACRIMMGLYHDALQDARDSVRLDQTFAKGYVRIAKCCLALGDSAAALNAINKAQELEPTCDLASEKRSLDALQTLTDEMTKSYGKGDYRKVSIRFNSDYISNNQINISQSNHHLTLIIPY